jgi:hypothetical protein
MMALDSENEVERAATWNSFPKVNLLQWEKINENSHAACTDARNWTFAGGAVV